MAKRKRGFTRIKYERWLKEGRGQGIGKEYKPWLTIQDVPSNGEATRIHGLKVDRQYDLLSRNEKNYFYIAEFADNVLDIMEQYPLLPIEQTEIIAAEAGIVHPSDPYTGENTVLTCDFLLKVMKDGKEKYIARTIKEIADLNNERQIQKFEIERRYWIQKEIDWGIVTENEISKELAKNISIVRPFYSLEEIKGFEDILESQISKLLNEFDQYILGEKVVVRKSAKEFDNKMNLEGGTGIKVFKHLVARKQIVVDMLNPINLDRSIRIRSNRQFCKR